MKAMLVKPDLSLVWSEVPDPEPKAGEVVIDIHATAVNRADLLQRSGKYPPPPGWPEWMGLECSGRISGAPAGSRWKVGDAVCALLGGGGYAERVAVPEGLVMPVPINLELEQAAALPEVFATAYLNLFVEAALKPGETVLVTGGAGGLGPAAIQMAKAFGAKVMTVVSSEAKAAAVAGFGADFIVNRRTGNLADVMKEHPVDVALDCVGGELLANCLELMAIGGRWILISTLGGIRADIALRPVLKRGLRLIGSTLRSRSNATKGFILAELTRAVWPKIASGVINPAVHAMLPIAEVERAHAMLEHGENVGKVVLKVK